MGLAFVTGGAGFIGHALIRRLIAEGHSAAAFARSDEASAGVAALGADTIVGRLDDPFTYASAAAGSDAFLHLAARTDFAADRAAHMVVTWDEGRPGCGALWTWPLPPEWRGR